MREEPQIASFSDAASYEGALRETVERAKEHAGLTAVIANDRAALKRIAEMLGDAAPRRDRRRRNGARGVVLMTLEFAKGPRIRPRGHPRCARRGVRRRPRGEKPPLHEHLARHGTHHHSGAGPIAPLLQHEDRPA